MFSFLVLGKKFEMNLGHHFFHNATSYVSETYNFLESSFRKQIDKRAARRVEFGTSCDPLGRQEKRKRRRGREDKRKKNKQESETGLLGPGGGGAGGLNHP